MLSKTEMTDLLQQELLARWAAQKTLEERPALWVTIRMSYCAVYHGNKCLSCIKKVVGVPIDQL